MHKTGEYRSTQDFQPRWQVSVYGASGTRFTIDIGRMASCTHTMISHTPSDTGHNHVTPRCPSVKSVRSNSTPIDPGVGRPSDTLGCSSRAARRYHGAANCSDSVRSTANRFNLQITKLGVYLAVRDRTTVNKPLSTKTGARRGGVACSHAYAMPISSRSPHGRADSSRPNGNPLA